MPYPLPLTRTEAYLAYKAGVITAESLKPSLSVPRIGIDAWLAYWTGLNNDYPKDGNGDPLCLTQEEAYVAYLSGVLNEYPENALHRVSAYLRYLISARWGRPDHPLNREELYLSLMLPPYIPSGDPSSDITIDGTAKAPFIDVKMYGDTYQHTYTGKNLLQPKNWEQGGIITEYNSATGEIHVHGTPTTYWATVSDQITLNISAGSYTLSLDKACPTIVGLGLTVGGTRTAYPIAKGDTSKSVSVTSTPSKADIYLSGMTAGTEIDFKFKIQFEAGSQATPFEPYVGGVHSPSPEFPQQIQTVTGEQIVEVNGKNKLDVNAEPYAAILSDYEVNGDEIAITYNPAGSGTGNYSYVMFRLYVGKDIEAGQTYTLSYDSVRRNVGEPSGRILFTTYSSTGESPNNNLAGANYPDKSVTFTVPNNAIVVGVALYCPKSEGVTQTYSKVMLEKGSSPTSFVPYSKNTYQLDLGSIKLCKLSTYQDYIWKDGDDWKVHKATGYEKKLVTISGLNGNASVGGASTTSNGVFSIGSSNWGSDYDTTAGVAIASSIIGVYQSQELSGNSAANSMVDGTFCQRSGTNDRIYFRVAAWAGIKTVNDVNQMMTDNGGIDLWYPLASPTDTVITDSNLIAQLNALKQGGAEDGTTYIKVNANDPNLPGLLVVEAPKYE